MDIKIVSRKIINIREIQKWVDETNSMRYPVVSSKDPKEKSLAIHMSDIKYKWLKPLNELNTEQEKEAYKKKHPELKEVIAVMEEIDIKIIRNCLEKLKRIKNEIENKNFEGKLSGVSGNQKVNSWIEEFKNIKNIIYNMYGSWNTEKKEMYKQKYPEVTELINIIKILNNNNKRKNFYKARKIKNWAEEKQKKPYSRSKDEEERRLGRSLEYIQKQILEPYIQMNDDEKQKYKEKNPDIEKIKEIIDQINNLDKNSGRNVENRRIRDMKEIQNWMNENNAIRYPSPSSKDIREKELGRKLFNIRRNLIKPYNNLETKKQKEAYRKKHQEFDEVISIIEEIDINIIKRCLQTFKDIKSWIDTTKFTGRLLQVSKNEEVRTLAVKFEDTKNAFDKIYINWDMEQKERCRREHPEIEETLKVMSQIENNQTSKYIYNAREIKKWYDKSKEKKVPKLTSKDNKERSLARHFNNIRENIIKPYYRLETEEERTNYKKKRPYLDEILEIIGEIDVHPYVLNARNIKEWSEANERIPKRNSTDEEEDRLATQLKSIRYYVVKPYMELNEEERQNYRRENEDMCEAIDIIANLDIEYGSEEKKELASLIQKDLEKERVIREARILKGKYEHELKSKETNQNNNGR